MTAAIARPSMICAVATLRSGYTGVDFAENDLGQKIDLRERRMRAVRVVVRRRSILERLRIDSHVERCPLNCCPSEERRTSDVADRVPIAEVDELRRESARFERRVDDAHRRFR